MSILDGKEIQEHTPDTLERLMYTTAKVYFLLDAFKLWSEEGTFTFPDGDIWSQEEHERFKAQGL